MSAKAKGKPLEPAYKQSARELARYGVKVKPKPKSLETGIDTIAIEKYAASVAERNKRFRQRARQRRTNMQFYAHEVLDRAHIVFMNFHEAFENHTAIKRDRRIKRAFEFVGTKLFEFYQVLGCNPLDPRNEQFKFNSQALDNWLISLYKGYDGPANPKHKKRREQAKKDKRNENSSSRVKAKAS